MVLALAKIRIASPHIASPAPINITGLEFCMTMIRFRSSVQRKMMRVVTREARMLPLYDHAMMSQGVGSPLIEIAQL